jgi:hypothetical protein
MWSSKFKYTIKPVNKGVCDKCVWVRLPPIPFIRSSGNSAFINEI